MRILYVGDIVGSPGRRALTQFLATVRQERQVDFVVANTENAAGGRGVTPEIADALFEAGADVLTLGDHAWDQRDIVSHIESEGRLLRPANLPPQTPGRGWATFDAGGVQVSVMQLIGRVFMQPLMDCPFRTAERLLAERDRKGGVVLVELHAEATSEKIAMGRFLDGRVSAVVGTHTHVQTSDERVLPNGTAYITDLGMTGPRDSVLGREVEAVLTRFLTGMPTRFGVAKHDLVLEGVLIDVDHASGKATGIERLRVAFGG